jgi:uncharacterized Tic20 family protein
MPEEIENDPVLSKTWLVVLIVFIFIFLMVLDFSLKLENDRYVNDNDDNRVTLQIGAAVFWLLSITLVLIGTIKITEFLGRT